MTMQFDWSQRPLTEWRELYRKAPRTNYLQSLPFARAVQICDQKHSRFALIKREDEVVGMAVVQEIKLGPVHVVHLYRGPLWFVPDPPTQWIKDFAELFNRTFPKRLLRMRRWLPECDASEDIRQALSTSGFRNKGQTYETAWLDLERPLRTIRSSLKPKWRNALNKGEKASLDVQVDWSGSTMNLFLAQYDKDKRAKQYKGRSVKFLKAEIDMAKAFKEVLILWAVHQGRPVAGVMVLLHGTSATYRIGWTTEAGRKVNAHNVLLWEAIKILKDVDIHQFDLGGVEPATATGLTHFKAGLGGKPFQTPGLLT